MKYALLLLAALWPARAQDAAAIERGARLFRARCAVPYCHGAEGTAGRAPRLIGHSLSAGALFKVITWGVPEKGMPGFTTLLKTAEIEDLVGYLATLRGTPSDGGAAAKPAELPAEAKVGRALFFDAGRIGSCGACHELDGWGVPAGPNLVSVPADLRSVGASRVKTARPAGEPPFPALVVEQSDTRVRVYDLSSPLPVLRTFSRLALEPGTPWRHQDATRVYTGGELEAIGSYLRAVLGRR